MRYYIALLHGSVYVHTVILDHEIYILCAENNNCIHVHDYVSVHIIIRSKFRYGTRGIALFNSFVGSSAILRCRCYNVTFIYC